MTQDKRNVVRRAHLGIVAAAVLTAVSIGTVTLRAQGGNPITALTAIGEKLDRIIETLDLLINPEPGPVRLSTGAAFVAVGQEISCAVANLTAATLMVKVTLLRSNGTSFNATISLETNEADTFTIAGNVAYPGTGGLIRCQYEFTGGPNDVRANGLVRQASGFVGPTVASLPAE